MSKVAKIALGFSLGLLLAMWCIPAFRWAMTLWPTSGLTFAGISDPGERPLPSNWYEPEFQNQNTASKWVGAAYGLSPGSDASQRLPAMFDGLPAATHKYAAQLSFLRHSTIGMHSPELGPNGPKPIQPPTAVWRQVFAEGDAMALEMTGAHPENAFPWLYRATLAHQRQDPMSGALIHQAAQATEFDEAPMAEYEEAIGILGRTQPFTSRLRSVSLMASILFPHFSPIKRTLEASIEGTPLTSPARKDCARIGDLMLRKGSTVISIFVGKSLVSAAAEPNNRSSVLGKRKISKAERSAMIKRFATLNPGTLSPEGLKLAIAYEWPELDDLLMMVTFKQMAEISHAGRPLILATGLFLILTLLVGWVQNKRTVTMARGLIFLCGLVLTFTTLSGFGGSNLSPEAITGLGLLTFGGLLFAISQYERLGASIKKALKIPALVAVCASVFYAPELAIILAAGIVAWPSGPTVWIGTKPWLCMAVLIFLGLCTAVSIGQSLSSTTSIWFAAVPVAAFLSLALLIKLDKSYRNRFAYLTAGCVVCYTGLMLAMIQRDTTLGNVMASFSMEAEKVRTEILRS